jgi:Protein of unknown function (DUF664)
MSRRLGDGASASGGRSPAVEGFKSSNLLPDRFAPIRWVGARLSGALHVVGRTAVPADRAAADVLAGYRAAIQDSNRAIRAADDPEARFAVPVDGSRHTLPSVMAHMTSQTARHAGHADILREQLDGTTGR